MKKIIILPYFGEFNNYFPLWLNSVKENKTTDFLIVTDNEWKWDLPSNVIIINWSFDRLKSEFTNKFNKKLKLDKPYKLCDFKPYYGFLFSDYITDYDFWGYCDCDLIFGNIDRFLSKDLFDKYDKILRTGHLSFIRNKREINENFLSFDTYKTVIKSPAIYGYDESIFGFHDGFAGELISNGYSFYRNDELVADINFRHYPFRVVSHPEPPCVFTYEEGNIFRIDKSEEGIKKTEMMYIHLQKRKMKIMSNCEMNKFIIRPNTFCPYSNEQLENNDFWDEVTRENCKYFNNRKEMISDIKRDLTRFLYEPQKVKSIIYRFANRR